MHGVGEIWGVALCSDHLLKTDRAYYRKEYNNKGEMSVVHKIISIIKAILYLPIKQHKISVHKRLSRIVRSFMITMLPH